MRRLTELEILRAEVELLRRQLKLVEDLAERERGAHVEHAKLLLDAWRDEVRRNDKDI